MNQASAQSVSPKYISKLFTKRTVVLLAIAFLIQLVSILLQPIIRPAALVTPTPVTPMFLPLIGYMIYGTIVQPSLYSVLYVFGGYVFPFLILFAIRTQIWKRLLVAFLATFIIFPLLMYPIISLVHATSNQPYYSQYSNIPMKVVSERLVSAEALGLKTSITRNVLQVGIEIVVPVEGDYTISASRYISIGETSLFKEEVSSVYLNTDPNVGDNTGDGAGRIFLRQGRQVVYATFLPSIKYEGVSVISVRMSSVILYENDSQTNPTNMYRTFVSSPTKTMKEVESVPGKDGVPEKHYVVSTAEPEQIKNKDKFYTNEIIYETKEYKLADFDWIQ